VRRLDAFGSAVRSDFDAAHSDLDFLVEFDDMPPLQYSNAFFELKEGLEALFSRPVDLVVEGSIRNPHFKSRVQAERRPVFHAT
jgi:predicted nucleotidyltransferase